MRFIKNNKIALCLIAVALAFILFGLMREEAMTVIRKATNICMECIGLG